MRKRRKQSTPLMLFWSKRDQQRFIEAVERLVSTVSDFTFGPPGEATPIRGRVEGKRDQEGEGQRRPRRRGRA